MAVRDIKTTILLDGEKAFEAELRAISKEMRVTNSELKVLKTGFDNADDQMANLTRQSQLAKEKLEQQKIVVAALEREVRDAARVHGDASDEVKDLTLKLNSARVAMNGMVKESQQVDREIEEMGRDSQRAGRQIKNGIGDAAEETSRDLRSMMDTFYGKLGDMRNMQGIDLAMDLGSGDATEKTSRDLRNMMDTFSGKLGDMRNMQGIDLAMDFAGDVVDLVQGVNSFAESSRDFNRQMSFLENNARQAGLDLDFVKDKFIDIASVTGETDGAVEGLSNLLQTGFDETEMEKAIRGLTGAVTQFPDTLKFESLADGLQETLATGQATGQYAELLERMGVDLDEFNAALAAAETAEAKQQVALAYLTGTLTDAGDEYKTMNQDLIDAEASSLRLETASSALGRTLDTWLTPGRNAMAGVIEGINEALNDTDFSLIDKIASVLLMPSTTPSGDLEDAKKYNQGTIEAQKAAGIEMPVIHLNEDQDFATEITETIKSQESDIQDAGQTAGMSMGTGLATGLARKTNLVVAEISATVDQINEELSRVNPINLSVNTDQGGGGASTGGEINVSLAMDGRTVGKVVAPYVMQAAGRTTAAMTTVQKK